MRILIIPPYLGTTYGGIAKVVLDFAKAIGRHGVNVDVANE